MIVVENLSKTFKIHRKNPGLKASLRALVKREWIEVQALKQVSLEVKAGEIVGLVGANGAGKTTLVKLLAGIIHPSSGSARVLGFTPWERHYEFRKQIALIMGQKAQLWWDLPAADCFILLREIYQIPQSQFDESLKLLATTLDITDQLTTPIRRLSLGERMKMELIATLLHQPKVVFLDEPTIGLDLTSQRKSRKFLLEYRERFQPAMVLTSHYMEDIESVCERIVIIREGSFVYDGPLSKVVTDYANYKLLTFHLRNGVERPVLKLDSSFGEVVAENDLSVTLKIPRLEVASVATRILQRFEVQDLSIDEQDIGTIIEAIMRKQ